MLVAFPDQFLFAAIKHTPCVPFYKRSKTIPNSWLNRADLYKFSTAHFVKIVGREPLGTEQKFSSRFN